MELIEVKKMRTKQIAVTNGLLLLALIFYFILVSYLHVTVTGLFLVMGAIILIQTIVGILKGNSTKSFIPIFEKVSNYEKEKMGIEWRRQRKMSYIWNILLSGWMFLQSYWSRDSSDPILIDVTFTILLIIFITAIINISLITHIRKIDRSTSVSDIKGYTWKSSLIAIVVGLGFGLVIFVLTILYVMLDLG
ncbi:hypothetical protein [Metabacillus fastidiosus]|uniref:hypothetical protein n=1 Tax=Metabacillus fastidiosus TaxID=1458 RepID=UPI002E1D0C3E|nr:hypothetical protein [Metabacillus fastidiosus]